MKKHVLIFWSLLMWLYTSSVVANGCNIFVGNLSYRTTAENVRIAFEEFGTVSKVDLKHEHGKSKGLAYVYMPDCQEAQQAIINLNNSQFDGRTIRVQQTRSN